MSLQRSTRISTQMIRRKTACKGTGGPGRLHAVRVLHPERVGQEGGRSLFWRAVQEVAVRAPVAGLAVQRPACTAHDM